MEEKVIKFKDYFELDEDIEIEKAEIIHQDDPIKAQDFLECNEKNNFIYKLMLWQTM
jgi:hypothetical protein